MTTNTGADPNHLRVLIMNAISTPVISIGRAVWGLGTPYCRERWYMVSCNPIDNLGGTTNVG